MNEDKVKLNEKEMTKEDFNKKKESLESKKGVTVVETGQNEYKSKIQG